jgi:cytoskeleton protein RodZ
VPETPVSIGQQLADARREAGLTIADVSDRTRVRGTVVEAIEHDEYGPSGGDIYARGHIRSIASVVGIDSAPLIAAFDEQRQPQGPDVTEVFEHETSGQRMGRRGPNWTGVMAVALVVVVALIGWQVVTSLSTSPRAKGTVAAPTQSPVETITPTPSVSPTESEVAQAPKEVVLVLATLPGKRSWISVSNAQGQIFQGTLESGQSKTFRDKRKLSIVVGDASAVDLTVNGTDVGTLGGDGEVVSQSFGPNDPVGSSG